MSTHIDSTRTIFVWGNHSLFVGKSTTIIIPIDILVIVGQRSVLYRPLQLVLLVLLEFSVDFRQYVVDRQPAAEVDVHLVSYRIVAARRHQMALQELDLLSQLLTIAEENALLGEQVEFLQLFNANMHAITDNHCN